MTGYIENEPTARGTEAEGLALSRLSRPFKIGVIAGFAAIVGGILLAFGGPLAAMALLTATGATFVVLNRIEVGYWAVIAVICLLPFATLPVDVGLTPTLLDVALGAVIGVWALGVVTGRQRSLVTTPITLPLLAFIIVALFAFILGLRNGPLTPTLLRHFAELILSLGFVLVVIDYCRDWSRVEGLVRVFLYAGAVAALLGIGLWLLPDDIANMLLNSLQRLGYPGGWVIRYIEENPELAERAIATSVDPNSFGGLLLLVGAVALPQLVSRKPLIPRKQAIPIFLLVMVALVLTFSRGAMVGLAAGILFLVVVRYRRILPYLAVLSALALLLPPMQGYIARFTAGVRGEDLATQMRFGEYADALTLIGRYPVFGVGFAGSPDIDVYLGVASVYLTIGQQMGILGLLAFGVLILVAFGYAYFNRGHFGGREPQESLWLGLHAALVGGLVAGVFDHYLINIEFHHAVTVFWFLFGLAVSATRLGIVDGSQQDQKGSELRA